MKFGSANHLKKFISVIVIVSVIAVSTVFVFASSGNFNQSTVDNAISIAKQMEAEGIVLLKNERNSLPLADKKVNVFGMGSINFALGGGGSGSVSSDNEITFYEGLNNAGIEYNSELVEVYQAWADSHSMDKTGQGLIDMVVVDTLNGQLQSEMPFSNIGKDVLKNAEAFSENAILVITRTGAELFDLKIEDIRLTAEELGLVEGLNSWFDNVIVVFNTCNIRQRDVLNSFENGNSALFGWTPGE